MHQLSSRESSRVNATAQAEFDRIVAPSKAEIIRVVAEAAAKYDRAIAPALAEYERVTAPAEAEYDRVVAHLSLSAKYNRDLLIADCKLNRGVRMGVMSTPRRSSLVRTRHHSASPSRYIANPARDEFLSAIRPARAEYTRVTAPARGEFWNAESKARAEYERVTAPAEAEYDRVVATAQPEFDRIVAEADEACSMRRWYLPSAIAHWFSPSKQPHASHSSRILQRHW